MSKAKRELTERESEFLEAVSTGMSFTDAKRKAGYSETTTVTSITKQLSEELLELANSILVRNAVPAALGMGEVLQTPAMLGAREKLNAAEKILDRVGIVKKDIVEVQTTGPAIVILPPKRRDEGDED